MRKRCANPACKEFFVPNKHSVHQRYCGRAECRRCRDAARQRRQYERDSQCEARVRQRSERKRRERRRRLDRRRKAADVVSVLADHCSDNAFDKSLLRLVAGLISMVSGADDYQSIRSILQRCMRKGCDLFPHGLPL